MNGSDTSIKAVVFDWAGTLIDHGSRAPMGAFVKVLAEFQVPISVAEARAPMGLPKWDHINALLTHPDIAARWQKAHGAMPTDKDVDRVFEVYVPLNASVVTDFADPIPGAVEILSALRSRGIKLGSTTGYTREIMERLLPVATKAGLMLDNVVCAGDLKSGRPGPMMMYKCFIDLAVGPAWNVIKVDDTEAGIAEGLSAGSWTVGVSLSGNALGLSRDELAALTPAELADARARTRPTFERAGAHYIIDSVADLEPVLGQIEQRLARGERP